MKLAYFTSRYPAISHTFIMREIMAVRARGIEVVTISQRTAAAAEFLAEADRREQQNTCYLLPPRWGRLAVAHVRAFFTQPAAYLSALWFAQRVRPAGLRAALWHLFYFAEAVQLAHEMRARSVGHVHVHFAGPCATVAMIAARLGGLHYSLTVHGSAEFFEVSRNLLAEKVADAAFVICVSDFTRSQVAAQVDPRYWEKLHVVHCGVDGERFRRSAPADVSAPHRVLCVARLVPAKGLALLIEAIARLAEEVPDLKCTLVGDGPDRARLERLADELGVSSRINFAGAVGQDDILPYYAAADVFVLPSFAEGVPVVLMEAMAMGVPAIATAVGGTSELIEHETSGLLVPPGNVAALTAALRRALADEALRRRLIEGGRNKVLAEFEMGDIGGQVARHFTEHLAEAGDDAGRASRVREASGIHAHGR